MTILFRRLLLGCSIPRCRNQLIYQRPFEGIFGRKEENYTRITRGIICTSVAYNSSKDRKMEASFRGALVGALVGDCLGAKFEFSDDSLEVHDITKMLRRIEKDKPHGSYCYTDDTAMLRSITKSFIKNSGKLDPKDLARRFTEEYFKERNRGYGSNIIHVFEKLKKENYEDPFGPALRQFDGKGSKGNGGSMRIAPAALAGFNIEEDQLLELVRKITKITHTHRDAINGAILQCLAVHYALKLFSATITAPQETVVEDFLNSLHEKMAVIEKTDGENLDQPYCEKLLKIKQFLKLSPHPSRDVIQKELGNNVTALDSVPSAIYSFLCCFEPISDIPEKYNSFARTIIYAISLNGDTDTIATMAGAIAGAYYGIDCVPQDWQNACEACDEALDFADALLKFL